MNKESLVIIGSAAVVGGIIFGVDKGIKKITKSKKKKEAEEVVETEAVEENVKIEVEEVAEA